MQAAAPRWADSMCWRPMTTLRCFCRGTRLRRASEHRSNLRWCLALDIVHVQALKPAWTWLKSLTMAIGKRKKLWHLLNITERENWN